jgi:hypothetical protein
MIALVLGELKRAYPMPMITRASVIMRRSVSLVRKVNIDKFPESLVNFSSHCPVGVGGVELDPPRNGGLITRTGKDPTRPPGPS